MNIYQKMAAATAEITAVAKNLNVGFGRNAYKAAGEADVLAAVKKIEEKQQIYSYPCGREIIETGIIENVKQDGSISKQNYLRIAVTYRFVNVEDPADFIDITSYGDGIDPGDKATGKAMTYADKYALMKAYKIITGEDPDQYMSEPLADKRAKAAQPRQAAVKAATDRPQGMTGTADAIDGRMQATLSKACQSAGKKPTELDSLKGITGWKDITIDQYKNAMKELGQV